MSQNGQSNRLLVGIVVILLVALCGAVCVGGAAMLFLMQPSDGSVRPASATAVAVAPSGKNILRLPGAMGGGDPDTLDPARVSDARSSEYVVEIFSGLVTLSPDLKVVPDIAERWEVSQDRKTYTFYLRQNVKFHDGRPVTAQDFKYSIERAANPALASPTAEDYLGDIVGVKEKLARRAAEVSGVQVVDDYTLKITIDAPKSYFLAKLTYPTAFVVDKNNVERGGRTWTDKPNGTGPFKLKEYVRAQRIVLARNENFYLDPKPSVDEVYFIIGGGSFMTMYENGDLESVFVSLSDIERASDPSSPLNKELSISPQLNTHFIIFNTRKPPFDDVKVRQAFALAINRQQIMDVVYRKMPLLADTILPPGMPGYVEPSSSLEYNPARAKQLLAESKYADKLPDITWTTTGAGGSAAQDVQAVTAMLKENLGVTVSIQQTDFGTLINQTHAPSGNPYQMYDMGWIADYADPQDFLEILFHSNSAQNRSWSAYSNPAVDQLLDQAGAETDTTRRFALYHQAEQMILADYPVIPLMHSRDYWLTKPYVKGMIYPALIIPRLRYVSLER